ncbi:hypothetical protein DACRYDRAFT_19092 [Dacryopinax primogenitus]|uniref:DUF6533 domain-containing protein n=1 Tax=Dacryopinax primogenitus (strain DJM 731) TaxID=1858805 RepID=M5FU78_DACPD|nr:uncharacterized protein DACRYDRAFT_19092 [Dacryopinax primogenitus]EJT96786.1 hypothetical protein DACRYDRAFT_19092 [Dacryopinax primogenitus]
MPSYEQVVQIDQQSTYGLAIGMTLWAYDWMLTLQQETQYVWYSKWTPGKILFLAVRYGGFSTLIVYLYVVAGADVTQSRCTFALYWALCNQVVAIGAASVILALRTYAVWNRNRIAAGVILAAWLAMVGCALRFLVMAIQGVTVDNLDLGLRGCSATNTSTSSTAALRMYITLGAYEGLIFAMTVARGVPLAHKLPKLTVTLYRDGLAVGNAVLTSEDYPTYYLTYFISLACSSVLPARIVLNIREATIDLDEWDVTTAKPVTVQAHVPFQRSRSRMMGDDWGLEDD